jgi:hypothetical protein
MNEKKLISGIVLPGERPLTLREVAEGLYVADNAYEYDAGYFASSPEEEPQPAPELPSEPVNPLVNSAS